MKFEIKNRFTDKTQAVADIDCDAGTSYGVQLGLAAQWAYHNKVSLRGANLRYADLSGSDMREADMRDADLSYAILCHSDMREADMRDAILRHSDMRGAILCGADMRGAYLSGADMRGATNLAGVPFIENIHRAVYAAASQPGAFDMSCWHKCNTIHCRAGWVIVLAGNAGKSMEWRLGTPTAASLIYLKSDPKIERIPNFYASDEEALADMKRLAEQEVKKGAA